MEPPERGPRATGARPAGACGAGETASCPVDGADLVPTSHLGVRIGRCPECSGVWLDAGVLRHIEAGVEPGLPARPDPLHEVLEAEEEARQQQCPDLSCPRCSAQMEKREYAYCSQVLIDTCPACHGVWLDGGELSTVERFLQEVAGRTGPLRRLWAWLGRLVS